MSRAVLRRLARILRPAGKHCKRVQRKRVEREALRSDMAWIGELFPATPRPAPGRNGPWQPRIARNVRVIHWVPGDTIIDGVPPIYP